MQKLMCGLLYKLRSKYSQEERPWELKKVSRLVPLFDEHNFWYTQPVPKFFEPVPSSCFNKPIEVKEVSDVSTDGIPLPSPYEWCTVDLQDDNQALEVYNLLTNHYVEDTDGKFRFDYSIDFLKWALNPPDHNPDWIVGVRGQGRLVGFITAIPVRMNVNGAAIQMAEVNFLCVHKKLRDLRVTPTLIREVTRRVNLRDQWQAIYTSGTTLPTAFGIAQYWHRNLNPQKLVEVRFAFKPSDITQSKFNKKHKLPKDTFTENLRPMTEADIPKVTFAVNKHLAENYAVHIELSEAEVGHFLLPRENVVWSWLVEDEETGQVQDFISFYALNSSILQDEHHDKIYAAYAYYNFCQGNDQARMKALMRDALILAKQNNFDVFNMVEVLKHGLVKEDLMFKPGDGRLQHYLYNYRIRQIQASDIGIVLV